MKEKPIKTGCSDSYLLALKDTLNVINGKWKLPIIASLSYGNLRFKEIERRIVTITPRMLSKELKELEVNGIVKRIVRDSYPVMVEYELTPSGHTIRGVVDKMVEWGTAHREQTIKIMEQ